MACKIRRGTSFPTQFFTYSCPKIRPFRSITRGYTGQKTNLALREHWKFSVECHQKRLGKLKQCIMDISAVPLREIVQFLRGENYFYIDYLLTLNYKSRNDVLMTLEYFQSHLLFARNYLANINALGILNWQAAV